MRMRRAKKQQRKAKDAINDPTLQPRETIQRIKFRIRWKRTIHIEIKFEADTLTEAMLVQVQFLGIIKTCHIGLIPFPLTSTKITLPYHRQISSPWAMN